MMFTNEDKAEISPEAARLRRLRRDVECGSPEKGPVENCCAMRESARGTLQHRVDELRREAHNLETLSDSLPAVLTPAQDEALWSLLGRMR